MTEQGFLAAPLWQRTLGAAKHRDGHNSERERLRASYLSLRTNAVTLLAELSRSVPDFTVHDISHVDALWETASLICADTVSLTPAEAYVLGCAFILHDAAMGEAAYLDRLPDVYGKTRWRDLLAIAFVNQNNRWPTESELSDPPAELVDACTSRAIRETHAEHAARLVDQPWKTSSGNSLYLLEDLQLRESYGPLVGDLAASHWWDVGELPARFRHSRGSLPWQPAEWIIDPLKLACILRLADAAQIDSRRAPTFLFAIRRPGGISRLHWRFQEHVSRPQLEADRLTYSCWRPFEPHDADAWWLALDYLRGVDLEMKKVDALLHDLGRPRLAARAVAGVDSPERFRELFPVRGWQPIDAIPAVTDVPELIESLGGEQLYGQEPEVAVRELIQNAHDAVVARQTIDPEFRDGRVSVALREEGGGWVLEVSDNGIGMDEEILAAVLLDFGRTGWRTDTVRVKFPGLAAGGFRPKGRFGIGFYSVFMLGDDVEVVSRRFDLAANDARRLRFQGVRNRPLLTAVSATERMMPGTTVRVRLKQDPHDTNGILRRTEDERLYQLVQLLVPESSVPILTSAGFGEDPFTLPPFTLATASAEEVFDRLYPPQRARGPIREVQRVALRAEFARRATPVLTAGGQRVGLATFGIELSWSEFYLSGVVTVGGFLADEHQFFAGYLEGRPGRASRDQAQFVAEADEFRAWLDSQQRRLRQLGLFGPSMQVELGLIFFRALGTLEDDHIIGMTSAGLLRLGDVAAWAGRRDRVFLCWGLPLGWETRPPRLKHFVRSSEVVLPEDWVIASNYVSWPILDDILGRRRDPAYESARFDRELTWQKRWWRLSDSLGGLLIRKLCEAWGCTIGDVLAPVADRGWNDYGHLGTDDGEAIPGYDLRRPGS